MFRKIVSLIAVISIAAGIAVAFFSQGRIRGWLIQREFAAVLETVEVGPFVFEAESVPNMVEAVLWASRVELAKHSDYSVNVTFVCGKHQESAERRFALDIPRMSIRDSFKFLASRTGCSLQYFNGLYVIKVEDEEGAIGGDHGASGDVQGCGNEFTK